MPITTDTAQHAIATKGTNINCSEDMTLMTTGKKILSNSRMYKMQRIRPVATG